VDWNGLGKVVPSEWKSWENRTVAKIGNEAGWLDQRNRKEVNERATQLLRFEEQFLSLQYRCQKIFGDAIFEEIQIYYLVSTSRFVGIWCNRNPFFSNGSANPPPQKNKQNKQKKLKSEIVYTLYSADWNGRCSTLCSNRSYPPASTLKSWSKRASSAPCRDLHHAKKGDHASPLTLVAFFSHEMLVSFSIPSIS